MTTSGTSTVTTDPSSPDATEPIRELAQLLHDLDRTDLSQRALIAAGRIVRPATVVCVVGEFKQGKSALVNALVGHMVCPVDDDLATSAITLVRWGETASALVRRRPEDGAAGEPLVVEAIDVADVQRWVSETGNPGNHRRVERVEITVPARLLSQGLVIVDTPGMGGLGAGHAASTLGFLPFADGLVFVSDASSELTAPELDFLARATELCPTVLFVQSKVDLYPQWHRIMELNEGHLRRRGIEIPVVGVSSTLRMEALRSNDRSINERSRMPELVRHLDRDVIGPAKATAQQRSVVEALTITEQMLAGLRAEGAALRDPDGIADVVRSLDEAKARLDYLRGPAAKWAVTVGDRVSDLSNDVTFAFRKGTRTVSRQMDERIETLTKGKEWDDLGRQLQADVAELITTAFTALEEGRNRIRAEVIELLRDEHVDIASRSLPSGRFDVADMWQAKGIDAGGISGKKVFTSAVTTIRGAQGGIYMFGMMGTFLPAAAGVLIASNPVLLGIGAIFGTIGLADDRKRKIAARRQVARSQVRQFLDDVQFEMGNQTGNLIREIQRDLRDEFSERITELMRTCSETAQRAQADAQRTGQDRDQRISTLDRTIAAFTAVQASLVALVPS